VDAHLPCSQELHLQLTISVFSFVLILFRTLRFDPATAVCCQRHNYLSISLFSRLAFLNDLNLEHFLIPRTSKILEWSRQTVEKHDREQIPMRDYLLTYRSLTYRRISPCVLSHHFPPAYVVESAVWVVLLFSQSFLMHKLTLASTKFDEMSCNQELTWTFDRCIENQSGFAFLSIVHHSSIAMSPATVISPSLTGFGLTFWPLMYSHKSFLTRASICIR